MQNSTKLLKKQQTVDEEKKIIALNDLNTYVDVFNRNSQIRLEAQTVTEQDYRNKLADLLKDCDTELSDVISVLYVKRPQIRGIISENMTLEKGTELFGVKFVDNEESSQLLGGESKKEITTDIYLPEELLLYRNEAEDINTSLLIQWDLDIREVVLLYYYNLLFIFKKNYLFLDPVTKKFIITNIKWLQYILINCT